MFDGGDGDDEKARISWINNLVSQDLRFKVL